MARNIGSEIEDTEEKNEEVKETPESSSENEGNTSESEQTSNAGAENSTSEDRDAGDNNSAQEDSDVKGDPNSTNALLNGTDENGNPIGSTGTKTGEDEYSEKVITGDASVSTPEPEPTPAPTFASTDPPTSAPTPAPTLAHTDPPTSALTPAPTLAHTDPPTLAHTDPPTLAHTDPPTSAPTPASTKALVEPESKLRSAPVHSEASRQGGTPVHSEPARQGDRKYDFFQTCMNVLAYKFHFPVKNLVLACGGQGLLNELEEGGYHVPVYGDELMDDYLHDAHEQSVWTNAWNMTFGDKTATDEDRNIAAAYIKDQEEDVKDGTTVSGDLNGDGVVDSKDAAITQAEWDVDANSEAPHTKENTGIQENKINSQWKDADSGNYTGDYDSGNGMSDNGTPTSDYFDGDAGESKGLGVEGNNKQESTGKDGNPDYKRTPNDHSVEESDHKNQNKKSVNHDVDHDSSNLDKSEGKTSTLKDKNVNHVLQDAINKWEKAAGTYATTLMHAPSSIVKAYTADVSENATTKQAEADTAAKQQSRVNEAMSAFGDVLNAGSQASAENEGFC